MRSIILLFSLLFLFFTASAQQTVTFPFYSHLVQDTFDITVITQAESGKYTSSVYYLDANLYSGKKLRQLLQKEEQLHQHTIARQRN